MGMYMTFSFLSSRLSSSGISKMSFLLEPKGFSLKAKPVGPADIVSPFLFWRTILGNGIVDTLSILRLFHKSWFFLASSISS